jgi:metallophosphoesterase (TIGR00282 family)
MKILFFGDVVGKPGRRALRLLVPSLARAESADLVIANCENACAGKGVDQRTADELFTAGIDVLTSGNHVWHMKDIVAYMQENDSLVRPANFPPGTPGAGWVVRSVRGGANVAVLNLVGRVYMPPADCPFRAADEALRLLRPLATAIVVDMHGEATSEKMAMGRYLDGRVSAVLGTHTHVQTADETILPNGAAYLTDAGMCGPVDSVIGIKVEPAVRRFLTQLPTRFEVANGRASVQGAAVEIDAATGRARTIKRIREFVDV